MVTREEIPGAIQRWTDIAELPDAYTWEGDDLNGGEWPYPDRFARTLAEGSLAEDIRRRLGVEVDAGVYLTEKIESGGYSEYTQENYRYLTIECGDKTIEFEETPWGSVLETLLRWLDEEVAA